MCPFSSFWWMDEVSITSSHILAWQFKFIFLNCAWKVGRNKATGFWHTWGDLQISQPWALPTQAAPPRAKQCYCARAGSAGASKHDASVLVLQGLWGPRRLEATVEAKAALSLAESWSAAMAFALDNQAAALLLGKVRTIRAGKDSAQVRTGECRRRTGVCPQQLTLFEGVLCRCECLCS